jgi:SUN domain-containing protein 1/2
VAYVADATLESHEQGLDSIAEHEEAATVAPEAPQSQYSRRAFSIGGFLGRIVNLVLRLSINLFIYVLSALSAITNIVGQGLGGAFDALFTKPARWIRRSNPAFLLKWLIIAAVLYYAWLSLGSLDLLSYIPSLPSQTTRYRAPEAPADNIAEISARLQSLENAFAGLSLDTEQSRARIDNQARGHSDVSGRLGALESRLQKEGTRAAEDRNVDRITASQGLQTVRHELDALRSIVTAAQQSEREAHAGPASDEEARRKLSALEERIGNVEGGVREALELGRHPVSTTSAPTTSAAWWHKITSSGKKALTIKASDGQDVTELIGHLVDTAISRHSKDTLAKADFALVSGGASVIPSLTSDTLEVVPQGFRQQVIGYLTGNGFAIGRPPITALHHETHNGYCWPFKGDQGQLGVTLAHPVFIEEITIDHVASEIAWDLRSAPRKMEVWGLVEGAKNHAKVAAWEDSRNEAGQEVPTQPRSLPHSAKYVRVAQFEYDIHKLDAAVQSFPIDEDVRALELDFGIVALRVLSNWGKEFTCLYRFRVHGRKFEEPPLDDMPTPGADAETA